jgi:hypothetical protein
MHTLSVTLTTLFRDLNYIGNVPEGHKLLVSTRKYSDPNSFIDWGNRKLLGEESERTREFVRRQCSLAIQEMPKYIAMSHINGMFIEKLRKAAAGIERLSRTYRKKEPNTSDDLLDSRGLILPIPGVLPDGELEPGGAPFVVSAGISASRSGGESSDAALALDCVPSQFRPHFADLVPCAR